MEDADVDMEDVNYSYAGSDVERAPMDDLFDCGDVQSSDIDHSGAAT